MKQDHYHRNKISIGLLLCVLLIPIANVIAETPSISLELSDVDIHTLVEIISEITGKNFIVDPRVEGEVSIITGRKLNNAELYEAFLTALQIQGYTVIERGSITKIMPSDLAKQETYPVVTDASGKAAEELITRLVHTEHVPALSVVTALRPISRNVRIQHHADSNTIILSGRAKDIERFITIIERLDSTDEKQIEVIPLLYANVVKMVKTINSLNKQSVIGKITKAVHVSADERTNSILVSGDASSRMRIRRLVQQLDIAKSHEGNTKVIRLRHATAENLAKVLEGSSTPRTSSSTSSITSPTPRATRTLVKSAVSVSTVTAPRKATSLSIKADRETNSLIITAEPDVLKGLVEVVKKLDVPRKQVLIETIVAEVSSQLSHSIGVQLGFSGSGSNSSGAIAATNYQSAGNNALGNVINIANGGVGALGTGLLLGIGGSSGGSQFAALLDTLVTDAATKILSTSTVSTLNNDEAVILSGQNIPPIWNPEFFGNTIVVNGKTWPFLNVEPKKYRFRLLNGSNARFMILKMNKAGLNFKVIGSDGGLLPGNPVVKTDLLIAPAERYDVIVDFSTQVPGSQILLQNVGPDAPYDGTVPAPADAADPQTTGMVMAFNVVPLTKRDKSRIPTNMKANNPLGPVTNVRNVTLNEVVSTLGDFPIAALLGTAKDGALTWSDAITESPALNAVEEWRIANLTVDAHPIHVHLVQFRVLERIPFDGITYEAAQQAYIAAGKVGPEPQPIDYRTGASQAPEAIEKGWKDTVVSAPGMITVIKSKFDNEGLYVWHCHILDHEDNEMMRPMWVGNPANSPVPVSPTAL